MRKQQIRHTGESESCGLRGVRQLNLLGGETHTQGMYLDGWVIHKVGNKRKFARKGRRRDRLERLRKRGTRRVSRAWSCTEQLNVVLGCSMIGLQKTRRPGGGLALPQLATACSEVGRA